MKKIIPTWQCIIFQYYWQKSQFINLFNLEIKYSVVQNRRNRRPGRLLFINLFSQTVSN